MEDIAREVIAIMIEWYGKVFNQVSGEDMYGILQLRQSVFILEQACLYADIDGLDQNCFHIYGKIRGEIKAYLRCIIPHGVGKPMIGRVIVAPDMRGRGYGRALMQHGMAYFHAQYPQTEICLAAQTYLQRFYESLGFLQMSEIYLEDGIPHIDMRLPPI